MAGDLFNSPYPDTQDEHAPSALLYPNQEYAPGDCENGNGQNCRNGNEGIKSGNCGNINTAKQCRKAKCHWVDGNGDDDGSCTDSVLGQYSQGNSAIDGAEAVDKPNSGMVVTAGLAWGTMTAVMMMWFVA